MGEAWAIGGGEEWNSGIEGKWSHNHFEGVVEEARDHLRALPALLPAHGSTQMPSSIQSNFFSCLKLRTAF